MTFRKGKSGNISGRPKGIPDKRTTLNKLFIPHAEVLITKAIDLAVSGDVGALKLCLERISPRIKSEPTTIPIPINEASNAKELMNNNAAIISAVSEGVLTLDEAKAFSELLETQYKFILSNDIEQRIAAIELTLKEKRNNEKH